MVKTLYIPNWKPKMALKFRINRYNWFGQKLLAQHQYSDIIQLYQYLTKSINAETPNQADSQSVRSTSEHLIYINGLALIKTSTRLDEVIYSLQQLSFGKNSQYFLLLCQCLLYIGNHDSVVEICKQVINKELSVTVVQDEGLRDPDMLQVDEEDSKQESAQEKRKLWLNSGNLDLSLEFKTIFASINKNHLINEPKLWFIFGLCLELQRQLKNAFFAFKVASNIASGNLNVQQLDTTDKITATIGDSIRGSNPKISTSNYCTPHLKYVEFCMKHGADFKSAIQTLNQVSSMFPLNYTIHPRLALLLSAQPSLSQANMNKSIEIISNLEIHSSANRNPSSGYNKIAAKFNVLRSNDSTLLHMVDSNLYEISDENRSSLDYLLIKSYLTINSIVQDSSKSDLIYRSNFNIHQNQSIVDNELIKQTETLFEDLKSSDISCWESASLWNNLGICYLIKRRFIASLSCLMKASQLNALDWRINYNLALACIHVGLYTKALTCLIAAKKFYLTKQKRIMRFNDDKSSIRVDPIINTLAAICFDKLDEEDEARTLFIEAIRPQKGVPIISLVNYLIFLHSFGDSSEKQCVKIKLHLLDQLEQFWLQRHQNNCQFNTGLLEIARFIGDETFASTQLNKSMKKTYAWAKS